MNILKQTVEGFVLYQTAHVSLLFLLGMLIFSARELSLRQPARERLGKAYKTILEWRRERSERQATNGETNMLSVPPVEKKVIPTSIPAGQYFSIDQVAQICRITPNSVKRWIKKGHLLPITIPGVGMLVELQELNRFLEKIGQPTIG